MVRPQGAEGQIVVVVVVVVVVEVFFSPSPTSRKNPQPSPETLDPTVRLGARLPPMGPRRRWASLGRAAPEGWVDDELGAELVRRWRRGDEAAFTEIFERYRGLVYGVLAHLLPRDPDLEDVVQAAFVEVFRSLSSFEGRSKLSSWIARVALHVGYHHLRRRKSRPAPPPADPVTPDVADESLAGAPDRAAEGAQVLARVYAILDGMAPKKRTVFILNDLQGLPQEEVAEVVGVRIATVRTRLFYARREFWKKAAKDPLLAGLGPPDDGS
jgi:RNA polymerase sigma-70 factor (ECF subfamily)